MVFYIIAVAAEFQILHICVYIHVSLLILLIMCYFKVCLHFFRSFLLILDVLCIFQNLAES